MPFDTPKGWKLVRLRDVIQECKERIGKKAAQVPVLSVTNSAGFQLSEEYFNKQVYSKDLANYKLVRKGQFAYNPSRVNVGSIGLLEGYDEGALSPMYVVFSTDESRLLPEYLKYWTGTKRFNGLVRMNTQGTVRESLSFEALASFPFLLPPLKEQQAIVAMLRSVDKTIARTQKLIVSLESKKRGIIAYFLSKGIAANYQRFQKTSIGISPETWQIRKLGEIAKIGNGATPNRNKPEFWDKGTIPWLTSTKIHDIWISEPDQFITEFARKECHLHQVPENSLLIALTGQGKTRGSAAYLAFPSCINQHIAYITLHHKSVDPKFVLAYLQSRYNHLRYLSSETGSTRAALTCAQLQKYPLPIPPIEEQTMIVEINFSFDLRIKTERAYLAQLQEVKRGLAQALLSGQARVPERVRA